MSLEQARLRVQSWLQPVPGPSPFGTDARYDPEHEAVRAEVAKLDAPGGGEVDWAKVLREGEALLAARSKDLLIAAYAAHALYEAESLHGLLAGVTALCELLEQAWEGLFPPPQRLKARAGAIAWFAERAGTRLALSGVQETEAALLDELDAATARLSELVQARFDQASPALTPLQAALQQARSATPGTAAAAGAGPSAAAAAAEAPTNGAAAPTHAAEQPAEAAPEAAEAAPAPDGSEILRARALEPVLDWLEPVSAEAPTGKDARYDPLHEELRATIKQLDTPTGHPVAWKKVVDKSRTLLTQRSKDLLPAAYAAYGLYQEQGLAGLASGLALLAALLERYWEGLFPDMARSQKARAAALGWLLGRLSALSERTLAKQDAAALEPLAAAAQWLADQVGERFEDAHRPAVQPLLEQVERLRASQQERAAAAERKAARPAAKQATEAKPAGAAPATDAATSVALPSGEAPSIANRGELNRYLATVHGALADAGKALRKANPKEPLSYLLPRLGAALELDEEPPSRDRVTFIPAPDAGETGEIRGLFVEQRWEALLDAAEGSATSNPLFLDMHRFVHVALARLGGDYDGCRRVVEAELGALLRRLPGVLELCFSNGTPFADADTRELIRSEILRGGGGPGEAKGGAAPSELPAEALAAARALALAGKKPQAVAAFEEILRGVRTARERFMVRLALANAVLTGGDAQLAAGLFATLYDEIEQRGLCEWEPELAADCLASYLTCLNRGGGGPEMAQRVPLVYARLCRVDPRRALETSQ